MLAINSMSQALLRIIRLGAIFRVALSFLKMIYEEDGAPYRRRIRNTLIFYALAELVFQLKDLAVTYFQYGGG